MTPVYVINLDQSVARWTRISSALRAAGIDFERVPAIDGAEVDQAMLERAYDAPANLCGYLAPLSANEVACFLSHRRAWQTFLTTSDDPFAVFLEDDAAPLCGDRELEAIGHALAHSDRPEIIKLYRPPSIRWVPRVSAHRRHPFVPPLGAVAQAMNRTAAQTLLAFTARFHEPVDVALQRWWDHGVRVSVACPSLFGEASGPSTIRHLRMAPAEGRLMREIRRPLFQLRRRFHAIMAKFQGRNP